MPLTELPPVNRNVGGPPGFRHLALLLVLFVAAAARLNGVGFGLPALNDPDEPLFMMTAIEMLRNQSFNPGWFGHPATTTLYCLALVLLVVGGVGIGSGQFANVDAFAAAVYADPALVWLPARLFIVACGVACVYLTWRLGRKLGDNRIGLIAALFLAVNAVHIQYSQIIRTDIQASVFMLLCALISIRVMREGRTRDYLLAGIFVGLACATKWPAAIIGISPFCAGLYRLSKGHREYGGLALLCAASAVTLIVVSPYLLLDYPALLRNLAGEARPIHPGATGGNFFEDLIWYVTNPLGRSFGIIGISLAAIGLVWPAQGRREWLIAVAPGFAVFAIIICLQDLQWERWVVPLLPFMALAAARALCGIADRVRAWRGAPLRWIEPLAALAIALPMVHTARVEAVERTHDTRQIASSWIKQHVPAGSTILLEHAGIDLLTGPWQFRFPLGSAGCVDARQALSGQVRYADVEKQRSSSPIVDIGYIDEKLIPTCRADYAILSHYDRYRTAPQHFGKEIARYDAIMRGGRLRAIVRPSPGESSGPVVRIVELRRHED